MRDELLQKEWGTTGKFSRTWKGISSHRLQDRNRRAVILICHSAWVHEEEEHAVHFMERRYHAGMQSHQGGLTFYCEDAGTCCCASTVHSLAHVLSFVLWEGLWQVEAVRLSSLYILIVLTVLEHLSLKPPGHLWFGLPSDLDGEPHRLRVHHRLIFKGLLKPRSPRPGMFFLIFISCRAVDDAPLVLHVILPLLQTEDKQHSQTVARVKATWNQSPTSCHAEAMILHIWSWMWEIYFLEGGINLLLLKLHPLQLLLLYPPPLLIFSCFGHLFKSGSHVHLLFEWWLLSPHWSCFSFVTLLENTAILTCDTEKKLFISINN